MIKDKIFLSEIDKKLNPHFVNDGIFLKDVITESFSKPQQVYLILLMLNKVPYLLIRDPATHH